MLPTAITLRNYRSFSGPVRLELRPITLLYGINNAGKSALLRSLPLLSDSLSPDSTGPLDLESPAARGSSFEDLRWKGVGEDEVSDLGVGISWGGQPETFQVDASINSYPELRRLIVRHFTVVNELGATLKAEWRPIAVSRAGQVLTYEIQTARNQAEVLEKVVFRGLIPSTSSSVLEDALAPAVEKLRELQNEVQWLAASRQPPVRISPFPTGPRWRMKFDGSDAATVLAANPDLLGEVSKWYERHLRRRLILQEVPASGIRLMLSNLQQASINVDVADTGEGAIQVLPVLTALALARHRDLGGPGILAIEEPESHLHASLQRALAESLCELASVTSPPKIILETHSEQLLLGIQLQILRGQISPADVMVYWVYQLENGESFAEPVTFDRDARPQGNWPPGVFAEDTEMAREIARERRARNSP